MQTINEIKSYASVLKLNILKEAPEVSIHQAQIDKVEYIEFLCGLLKAEVDYKQQKKQASHIKMATLPPHHDLDQYDYNHDAGIHKHEIQELRTLIWMENNYNLVLMGPCGVGKTYLAAGLVYDAVKMGYSAYFRTMGEIIEIIKLKEITSSAMNAYKRLSKAHLIAIDDVMLFPMNKSDAIGFFNFLNLIYERCSIIITTNKNPKEWAEILDDEVLASALLDRILFHCEVIKLTGRSYRMENRKTIFDNENTIKK